MEEYYEPDEYKQRVGAAMETIHDLAGQLEEIYNASGSEQYDEISSISKELLNVSAELEELYGWKLNNFRGD